MSLLTIRGSIKTVLEAVTGVGNVHDYIRHWAGKEKKFLDFFTFTSADQRTTALNSCEITRISTEEISHNQSQENIRKHKFLIFLLYSVNDTKASEKTFQDLIELISTGLRNETKTDTPFTALRASPPQIEQIEYRMIAGRLCHTSNVTMLIEEYVTF